MTPTLVILLVSKGPFGWRRRVGNYRVIYDLIPEQRVIIVSRIERRTTTTYRKR